MILKGLIDFLNILFVCCYNAICQYFNKRTYDDDDEFIDDDEDDDDDDDI